MNSSGSSSDIEKLSSRQTTTSALRNPHLTAREIDIIQWAARGYTAKRIGLLLKISYRTVEKNFENLKIKFNCHTKAELIYICTNDAELRLRIFGF